MSPLALDRVMSLVVVLSRSVADDDAFQRAAPEEVRTRSPARSRPASAWAIS